MKHKLRIVTANLCNESIGKKTTLINKWITHLMNIKGDIIFLQEVNAYNLEKLATELGLKILNINHSEGTSVLIDPHKFTIIDNNVITFKADKTPCYVGAIHLDDIPSVPHHINHMLYKSSEIIPLKCSLDQILKMSAKRRLPRIKTELEHAKKYKRAIIAGDFNEPSHLDLELDLPVSTEFERSGFIDTYRSVHLRKSDQYEPGYTWPANALYRDEPVQRIDMIYAKGVTTEKSFLYDGTTGLTKWISDHKILITDIVL